MAQRILDVTSSVARRGNVVCMHVAELVTRLLVILPAILNQAQRLLVGRCVVLQGGIAGIHVLHYAIRLLFVLM